MFPWKYDRSPGTTPSPILLSSMTFVSIVFWFLLSVSFIHADYAILPIQPQYFSSPLLFHLVRTFTFLNEMFLKYFRGKICFCQTFKRNWVIATNSSFLITLSLQPLIFQTIHSVKYQKSTSLGCKDTGYRISITTETKLRNKLKS